MPADSHVEWCSLLLCAAVPVWADIIVGVGIAFGVLIACLGYRFYVVRAVFCAGLRRDS